MRREVWVGAWKGTESRSPGESVAGSVVGVRLGHENGFNWGLGFVNLREDWGLKLGIGE